jgi:hypothetical protein
MNGIIAKPFPTAAPVNMAPTPAGVSVNNNWLKVGIFFAAHGPLAFLMMSLEAIATAHALFVLVAGTAWIFSKRHMERAAYVGAYITGAEVLWRMTDAQVPWEFGKYSMAVLFILAMVRAGRAKWAVLPLIYFLLLLPSSYMSFQLLSLDNFRKSLSFNLSGPFALMASVWFFSNLKLRIEQFQRMFLALIGPVIGIASVTALITFTASSIRFSDGSNRITSGGFGPNQVSAALGLGVLLAIFFLLDSKTALALKVLMFGAMVLLGVQSALTFSRGGLYMAAGGAILASLYLVRDTNSRIRIVLVVTAIFVVTNYVVLPQLDSFTGGSLSTRFQDTDPTGRDEIIMADLELWKENPVFGVGPGMGQRYRANVMKYVAAHTEYTRLLAEHGVLGAVAIILLIVMAVRGIRRSNTIIGKALAAAMLGWSFLFMMIDAMRLVAPAFTFGLAYATVLMGANLSLIPGRRVLNRATYPFRPRPRRAMGASRPAQIARDRGTTFGGGAGDGR